MIELSLTSPFWEDPATLSSAGDDETAVMRICISALLAAGYEIQLRDENGELLDLPEDLLESPDAEA